MKKIEYVKGFSMEDLIVEVNGRFDILNETMNSAFQQKDTFHVATSDQFNAELEKIKIDISLLQKNEGAFVREMNNNRTKIIANQNSIETIRDEFHTGLARSVKELKEHFDSKL